MKKSWIVLFFVGVQFFFGCRIERYVWHFDYPETKMPVQGTGWYKKTGNDSAPVGVWKKYGMTTDEKGNPERVLIEKSRFEVDSNGGWHPKGIYRSYYGTNGERFEKIKVKNGKIKGQQIIYFDNGNKCSVRTYDGIHDNPMGEVIYFHPNGKVKEKGNYGAPASVVTIDTIRKILIHYDTTQIYDSSKIGLWQEFYSNGKLKACGNYLPLVAYVFVKSNIKIDDQLTETTPMYGFVYPKDGIWKYYTANGEFERWEKYENGFLTTSGKSETEIKK